MEVRNYQLIPIKSAFIGTATANYVHENYIYAKYYKRNKTLYLRCAIKKCKALAVIRGERFIPTRSPHNHQSMEKEIQKRKLRAQVTARENNMILKVSFKANLV